MMSITIQNRMLEESLGRLNIYNPNMVTARTCCICLLKKTTNGEHASQLDLSMGQKKLCNQTYQRQLFLPPIPVAVVRIVYTRHTARRTLVLRILLRC